MALFHPCECVCLYSLWLWKVKRPGVSVLFAKWVNLQQTPSSLETEKKKGQFIELLFVQIRSHINYLLQVGIRKVQISFSSRHYKSCAYLHLCLVVHKPHSIGSKANKVPLACHLN